MDKFKNKIKTIFSLFICIVSLAIFSCSNLNFDIEKTQASDVMPRNSLEQSNYSLFIHSPTYSILYHQKIYFIDNYDNLLKIYDTNEDCFDLKYVDLTSIGTINSVAYTGEYLFVLSTKSDALNLSIINLPDIKIEKQLIIEDLSTDYSQISVCLSKSKYLLSLTPTTNENKPYIITLNAESLELENTCSINIDKSISETLFKLSIINSTGTTSNEIYLSLVYNDEICFFGTEVANVTTLASFDIDTAKSSLSEKLDTTNSNIEYSAVNIIEINNKDLFLITYTEKNSTANGTEFSSSSKLYEFEIDVSDGDKYFDSKLSIQTHSNQYVLTSNSCVVYPLISDQQICYTSLTFNEETSIYTDNTYSPISNPTVEIKYYNESKFEYVTANKKTNMLSTPWESISSSTYEIDPTESKKDLIVIGYGEISSENLVINDYKYCLFTTSEGNIKGFVKAEDLTTKEFINTNDYEYKVFKVQPKTKLYSFPTTIVNNQITPSLSATIVHEIEDNSRVEVIDTICKYTCNGKIMLKVLVNNTYSGYIEYDKIIKPSDKIDFIITNASIKDDNTLIYLKSSSESQIICTLEKGYRVRINGSRNTDSGFTSITFNDEYGNEFTGFIMTDSVGSDSWTTLQIIGCILIAINIGLLVLILKFKHKNIGSIGSKYIDNKK